MGVDYSIISRKSGFSLVEIIVALAVSAVLLAMLSAAIQRVTGTSVALDDMSEQAKQKLTLQRLFHRDVQNMSDPKQLSFEGNRLIFETSHSTLLDSPFPVLVTWDFSKRRIVRSEKNEGIDYETESLIAGRLRNWTVRAYDARQNRWLNFQALRNISADNADALLYLTAISLNLNIGDMNMKTTERFPYALLLQQVQEQ